MWEWSTQTLAIRMRKRCGQRLQGGNIHGSEGCFLVIIRGIKFMASFSLFKILNTTLMQEFLSDALRQEHSMALPSQVGSQVWSRNSSIGITWELVKSENSWALTHIYWIRNSEGVSGVPIYSNKPSRWFWRITVLEEQVFTGRPMERHCLEDLSWRKKILPQLYNKKINGRICDFCFQKTIYLHICPFTPSSGVHEQIIVSSLNPQVSPW